MATKKTSKKTSKKTAASTARGTSPVVTVANVEHPWIGKYVVFTTQTRPWAVVGGVLESVRAECGRRIVTVTDARMIVWYAVGTRSVLGLASHGPAAGSRVSPACEAAEYDAIEGIHLATAKARKAIEAEPWT